MALELSKAPLSSGGAAETGAELVKKFKRVSVQGGSLRGARYSDVSEADIRKSAKSYRGDPRFSQFCKQWVAAETFASDPELEKRTSEGFDKTSQAKTWLGLGWLLCLASQKTTGEGCNNGLRAAGWHRFGCYFSWWSWFLGLLSEDCVLGSLDWPSDFAFEDWSLWFFRSLIQSSKKQFYKQKVP